MSEVDKRDCGCDAGYESDASVQYRHDLWARAAVAVTALAVAVLLGLWASGAAAGLAAVAMGLAGAAAVNMAMLERPPR